MEDRIGEVRVADNVVAVVAGVAVSEVEDVSLRPGAFYQDWAKKLNGGAKGIQVAVLDGRVTIEIRVSVKYGTPIHRVCQGVQEKVKETVEEITGLIVEAVDVRVEAIEI